MKTLAISLETPDSTNQGRMLANLILDHATEADYLHFLKTYAYEMIVLYVGTSRECAPILKAIRTTAAPQTGVIVVAVRATDVYKARCLDHGADDVLEFDCSPILFSAAARAILRRWMGQASSPLVHGSITLDPVLRRCLIHGIEVKLSRNEFNLLELLFSHRGQVLSAPRLIDLMYSGVDPADPKNIDVLICRTRKRLSKASEKILNVWGRGYRLSDVTSPFSPPL